MDRRADCSSRPAATAMAAPAERRSPRAHRSYPPISRLSCVTGSWWRSQPCHQRTAPRPGRSGRWWPKISSPPPTRGWRLLSNCDCPRSCRPNAPGRPSAVGLGVHVRLPAMTRSERALVQMMSYDPARVDKSTLAVSAPPPLSRQGAPSLCCPTALPWVASDEFAVPLCQIHRRLVHRVGKSRLVEGCRHRSRLPASSGTIPAWIRGGLGRGRRRNVPRQIEQLTLSNRGRCSCPAQRTNLWRQRSARPARGHSCVGPIG